jgi:uncharacterized membrane protein
MAADGIATSAKGRDSSIDVLRGVAIVTMVAANMAPYVLETPHPLPLRIYGSFAAPTFVFLAGMMVGSSRRLATVSHALRRSAGLLVVAAGIDVVCWNVVPFTTFDVLYLIGLALPTAALCLALDVRFHALLGAAIVVFTPFVRARLGYGPLLDDPEPWPIWRRLLVDGWFPLFPWLGVALLGAAAGRIRTVILPRVQILVGGVLITLGLLAFIARPPELVTRAGYSELFYPPTIRYLCVAIGALLLLLASVPHLRKHVPLGWLEIYGRASLLMYVAHTVLIAFVFKALLGPQPLVRFIALYTCTLGLLWVIARVNVIAFERARHR